MFLNSNVSKTPTTCTSIVYQNSRIKICRILRKCVVLQKRLPSFSYLFMKIVKAAKMAHLSIWPYCFATINMNWYLYYRKKGLSFNVSFLQFSKIYLWRLSGLQEGPIYQYNLIALLPDRCTGIFIPARRVYLLIKPFYSPHRYIYADFEDRKKGLSINKTLLLCYQKNVLANLLPQEGSIF